MSARKHVLVVALLVFGQVCISQTPRPPVDAKRGDIASGFVESERDGRLYLNTTPCKPAPEAAVVVFHNPYSRTPSGEIVCYGHHFDKTTVEQQ